MYLSGLRCQFSDQPLTQLTKLRTQLAKLCTHNVPWLWRNGFTQCNVHVINLVGHILVLGKHSKCPN